MTTSIFRKLQSPDQHQEKEVIRGLPIMETEEINQLNGLVEKRRGIKGPKNSFHLISAVIIAD